MQSVALRELDARARARIYIDYIADVYIIICRPPRPPAPRRLLCLAYSLYSEGVALGNQVPQNDPRYGTSHCGCGL